MKMHLRIFVLTFVVTVGCIGVVVPLPMKWDSDGSMSEQDANVGGSITIEQTLMHMQVEPSVRKRVVRSPPSMQRDLDSVGKGSSVWNSSPGNVPPKSRSHMFSDPFNPIHPMNSMREDEENDDGDDEAQPIASSSMKSKPFNHHNDDGESMHFHLKPHSTTTQPTVQSSSSSFPVSAAPPSQSQLASSHVLPIDGELDPMMSPDGPLSEQLRELTDADIESLLRRINEDPESLSAESQPPKPLDARSLSRLSRNKATYENDLVRRILGIYENQMKMNPYTKRGDGPQLSLVSPLDVLRQQLMYEMARRNFQKEQDQIQANDEILKKIGKRSVDDQEGEGSIESQFFPMLVR